MGKAQEKTPVFRTEKRRNPETGRTYPWIVRGTAMVNHYYFYGLDEDFGPFFLKFCTYFPYTAKLCLNGHEWAKRQAARAGISFEALDNGFAAGDAAANTRYLRASWLVDDLLRVFLSDNEPERLLFEPMEVHLEISGSRGEFSIRRI